MSKRLPLRVLVVQSERPELAALEQSCLACGHQVTAVVDGGAAFAALDRAPYDLAILDNVLPDMHGLALVRTVRRRQPRLPIMIVSARAGLEDRVAGLDGGADDYVARPFEMLELEARIRALLRSRADHPGTEEDQAGPLRFSSAEPRVWLDGAALDLSPAEFALLRLLGTRPGQMVSRNVIAARLPVRRGPPSDAAVDLCVHRLRRRLAGHRVQIRTVRGFGYLLTTKE